jgi:hypothetical protein
METSGERRVCTTPRQALVHDLAQRGVGGPHVHASPSLLTTVRRAHDGARPCQCPPPLGPLLHLELTGDDALVVASQCRGSTLICIRCGYARATLRPQLCGTRVMSPPPSAEEGAGNVSAGCGL